MKLSLLLLFLLALTPVVATAMKADDLSPDCEALYQAAKVHSDRLMDFRELTLGRELTKSEKEIFDDLEKKQKESEEKFIAACEE